MLVMTPAYSRSSPGRTGRSFNTTRSRNVLRRLMPCRSLEHILDGNYRELISYALLAREPAFALRCMEANEGRRLFKWPGIRLCHVRVGVGREGRNRRFIGVAQNAKRRNSSARC